jgi:hypothetical protein
MVKVGVLGYDGTNNLDNIIEESLPTIQIIWYLWSNLDGNKLQSKKTLQNHHVYW